MPVLTLLYICCRKSTANFTTNVLSSFVTGSFENAYWLRNGDTKASYITDIIIHLINRRQQPGSHLYERDDIGGTAPRGYGLFRPRPPQTHKRQYTNSIEYRHNGNFKELLYPKHIFILCLCALNFRLYFYKKDFPDFHSK